MLDCVSGSCGSCNNHVLRGLNTQTILLQFWRLKVRDSFPDPKSRCPQGHDPCGGSGGESVSSPFPASGGGLHSLAHGASIYMASSAAPKALMLNSCVMVTSLHFRPSCLPLTGLLWFHGAPSHVIQDKPPSQDP